SHHVHQETHEMVAGLSRLLNFLKAFPQPLPLRLLPTVMTLEHRDHVLVRRIQDLTEAVDGSLHADNSSTAASASGRRSRPEIRRGSRVSRRAVNVSIFLTFNACRSLQASPISTQRSTRSFGGIANW